MSNEDLSTNYNNLLNIENYLSNYKTFEGLHRFFFNVRCPCYLSKKYTNCLCLSSFLFLIPAYLLLYNNHITLGILVTLLFFTSIIYHFTHNPMVRACDVSCLWIVGFSSLIYCFFNIKIKDINRYIILSLICIIILNYIHYAPHTHASQTLGGLFLEWHIGIHIIAVLALVFLVFGLKSKSYSGRKEN